MTNLEQSILDLCAKYDLTSVNVGVNLNQRNESYWSTTAHWKGFSVRGYNCVCEHGATIAEALPKMLAAMIADRTVQFSDATLADESLPELAA